MAAWSAGVELTREKEREGRARRETGVHYSKAGEAVVTGPESAEAGRN